MNASMLTASHCGVVRFGDLDCEAVVLTTGERGYVQRQLARALGLRDKSPGTQIGTLIREFAANSLSVFEKKGYAKVRLPSGQIGTFFPAGILSDVALGIIEAALLGRLHAKRQHIIPNCRKILSALATTGEVALIDEATGYQHHRAPDALQELISKLLRQSCASWERRFHPDYYRAIYRLFGWKYQATTRIRRTSSARSRCAGSTGRCCQMSCWKRSAIAKASRRSTTSGCPSRDSRIWNRRFTRSRRLRAAR